MVALIFLNIFKKDKKKAGWVCSNCHKNNFPQNESCFTCKTPKPTVVQEISSRPQVTVQQQQPKVQDRPVEATSQPPQQPHVPMQAPVCNFSILFLQCNYCTILPFCYSQISLKVYTSIGISDFIYEK